MAEFVPKSAGIVVLGMHRSGTSLAARLLGELGCSFGGPLMPAKDDNPEGFWEHADIVGIHDDFLEDMGRSWMDPRPWFPEDFASAASERARERLQQVFERDFSDQRLWVLKDPRLCRLLPLWEPIWAGSDHLIAFLHQTRNPVAIARSLHKRNEMPEQRALLLWLRHVLEAEAWTRGQSRAWVDFDEVVQSPLAALHAASGRMGISELLRFDGAADALPAAVKPSQVHHPGDLELETSWSWVLSTRTAVQSLLDGESETALAELDRVQGEMCEMQNHPLHRATVSHLEQEVSVQRRLLVSMEDDADRARGHIEKLEIEAEDAKRHLKDVEAEFQSLEAYCHRLEGELGDKAKREADLSSYTRKLEALIASGSNLARE